MTSLFPRNGWLHIRFYHPLLGRSTSIATGYRATKEGEREARKYQRDFELKLRMGQVPLRGMVRGRNNLAPLTIQDGYAQFLEDNPNLAKKTKEMYDLSMDHFKKACGVKPVKDYTREDNYKFRDYLKRVESQRGGLLSHNSQAAYTRHVGAVFTYFVEENVIEHSPIRAIPQEKYDVENIPIEILKGMLKMLKAAKKMKQYYFIKFLALSGFRAGEAIALKWQDIHFEDHYISFRNFKAKRQEAIPITRELEDMLKQMTKGAKTSSVFGYKNIEGIKTFWRTLNRNYEKELKKKDKDAVCKYTIHQIRKTTASYLANNKVHDAFIQKYIRHMDFSTTEDHYIRYESEAIREELNNKIHFNLP